MSQSHSPQHVQNIVYKSYSIMSMGFENAVAAISCVFGVSQCTLGQFMGSYDLIYSNSEIL